MDTDDLLVRAYQPRVTAQVSPSRHLWQSDGSTGRYLPAGAAPPCPMVMSDMVGCLPLALLSTLESQPLAKDTIPNDPEVQRVLRPLRGDLLLDMIVLPGILVLDI